MKANINVSKEPEVSEDGYYAYCPVCGYYDLMPIQHDRCPKCKQLLDWDWFEKLKIKK